MTDQPNLPVAEPESVPKSCPDDGSSTPPAPSRRRGGAPKGNTNGLKHGLFAKAADALKRRRTFAAAAEAEVEDLLADLHLDENPLALRIGRRMASIEVEIATLTKFIESRGRTNSDGTLKPAYAALLDLTRQDLECSRRLLDQLAEVAKAMPVEQTGTVKYVCTFSDGTEIGTDHPGNSAAQFTPPAEPEAAQAPVQSPRGEAAERSLARKLRRHTEASSACDGLLVPGAGTPEKTQGDKDDLARRYLETSGWRSLIP